MKKKIAILGSTGSVGRQTVEVIGRNPDLFEAVALTGNHNAELLRRQKEETGAKYTGLYSRDRGCLYGALESGADIIVAAASGIDSLPVICQALRGGLTVALANKESLVAGGEIIKEAMEKGKGKLIPVDSEHSAIFQCLEGLREKPESVILTASGGPFYNYTEAELKAVTPEMALRHPKWRMGRKITVDSATMMNKGLEIIEAAYLFEAGDIEVVVHPECVIHSMVRTRDGAVMAQMSFPDMRLPILYALTYPGRIVTDIKRLDFEKAGSLTFRPLKEELFPATRLARQAYAVGGGALTALLAADEVAVEEFLGGKLAFTAIAEIVEEILSFDWGKTDSIEEIEEVYKKACSRAEQLTGAYNDR